MVEYTSKHIPTFPLLVMSDDVLSDAAVDRQCSLVRKQALECAGVTRAFSIGSVASMVLGWSPVIVFGMVVGFGMTMAMARGVADVRVPSGAPQSDPAQGMLHGAAYAAMSDERPSWIPVSDHPAASSSSSEDAGAIMSPVPQPFENRTPALSSSSEAPVPEKPAVRTDNKVGVYLTSGSVGRNDFFLETLDKVAAASGSSIVFDVKGSRVFFHSAAPEANDIGLVKPLYDLPEALKAAHERGLYVIGRFVSIKDDGLTTMRPETRVRDPQGKYVISPTWVDPSNELAVKYNTEVACELAQAGIDEINLDYIRFSTADFGALRVYSGQEKADHVEVFIKAIREAIDRCGPNTKLGLSTFAILGWDYDVNVETLGQDVVRFAKYVDVISPMAYPATFTSAGYYVPGKNPRSRMYWLVYRTLTGYEKLLGDDAKTKLRPWIQGYGVTKKDMRDQIDAVYDAGLCGFQVWNAGNHYDPVYAALKDEHTRPEDRCGGTGSHAVVQETDVPAMNW